MLEDGATARGKAVTLAPRARQSKARKVKIIVLPESPPVPPPRPAPTAGRWEAAFHHLRVMPSGRCFVSCRRRSRPVLGRTAFSGAQVVIRTPSRAPMCNAYAERFVRESRETLNNVILLGEHHFHHVLKRIECHHNRQRPHQGPWQCDSVTVRVSARAGTVGARPL